MHAIPYGVAIPIRSFDRGMERLAASLSPEQRSRLARDLAATVVAAAADAPVVVVSSDGAVCHWATDLGVATVADPGDLDRAAAAGRDALTARGCRRVIVAHADLPYARTFDPVVREGGPGIVVIVPCHRDDGTPVISLPAGGSFAFSYGPGSFRRHVDAARASGLVVRVVRDPDLAFDLDTPDDLAAFTAARTRPR